MFSTKFIAAAAATFSLISSSTAVYDPSSQRNLAMYWGSGANQYNLSYYCDQPNVDIIPIGFINIFPPQANGLVAETFGNQCWNGNYTGPGYNGVNNPAHNYLYEQCPQLQESLYYCQQKTNKKILLSLGGAAGDYYLNGVADGVYLAEFLWGAYGPYNASWTGVRPLDRGYYNTDTTETIDFDGFDFDIEQTSPDQQAGYIACINRLRELFAEHKAVNPCSKDYIISGAPQCPLDEPYMSTAIAGAKFDILWIQFYNNGANGCTARNYIDSLASKTPSGFNYDSWVTKVNAGKSAGAKLYIGLLAGQAASSGSPNDYINAANVQTLVTQYHSHAQFGGVMLYEATVAENNGKFYNQVKAVLNSVAAAGTVTSSATICSSTTSSTSTSTTSSKISSTSSTSSKPTSTSASSTSSTASSTSSSSSSSVKPTTSSISSTSSSATSSSSSSTLSSTSSSSSTLSSSSSSDISSSTSVPVSSTSTSSVVSLPPTSTPTPTTVPSVGACSWIGCYSEATSVRALSGATYVNYTLMSVEICSSFCTGYTYFGVEYGGECYCGDSFGDGSTVQPTIDCSQTCDGTPTELCGAGNRLDVYQCGSGVSSSSIISSSTSSSLSSSSSSSVSLSSSSSVVSPTSTSSISSTLSSSSSVDSSTSSSTLSSSSSIVSPTVTSTLSSSSSIVSSSSVSSIDSSSTISSTSVSDTSSSVVSTSSIYSSTSVSSTLSSSSSSITSSSSVSSGTSSVYPTTSGVYTNSTSSTSTKKSVCTRKTTTTSSSVTLSSSSTPYSNGTSTSISMSGTSSFTPTSSATVPTSSGTSTSSGSGIVSSSTSVSVSGSSSVSATGSSSSSTVSGTSTSTGGGIVSSPSPTSYTTSTVYTTSVYTITSCAATVTNCPAVIGSVTTETIIDYTTVCPVTATETGKGYPTTTPTSSPSVTAYTTSTVYKTTTYTITSCPATVTNCPAKIGSVTTEVVVDYTTVCPVTATETYPTIIPSSSAALPGKGGKVTYTPISSEGTGKTTTLSSTTTSYVTVKYVESTATIVPVPVSSSSAAASVSTLVVVSSVEVAPYPTGPANGGVSSVVGTGTGVPVVKGVSTSTYAGVATSSPTSTQFTGAAASVKASWVMGFVAVGLGLLL